MVKIEAMPFTLAGLASTLSKTMNEGPTTSASPLSDQPEWRPFTVPNAMSLIRLACIPLFVWLLFAQDDRVWSAVLLAALGSTDWVDGWFARRFDQVVDALNFEVVSRSGSVSVYRMTGEPPG